MNETTITDNEAINIINRNVKGTTAVSIDIKTSMDSKGKMKKTDNPFVNKGLVKIVTLNGLIGFDYENSVNNQATRENKKHRETKSRAWGTLTENRLFVTHKDNFYLQVKVQNSSKPVYQLPNGSEVPSEQIKPFLPKKHKSSTQNDIKKEVIVRDIKMSNITGMRFNNGAYNIIPETTSSKVEYQKEKSTEVTETTQV